MSSSQFTDRSSVPRARAYGTFIEGLRKLFTLKQSTLFALGFILGAHGLLEGVEAVGLWFRRRLAEHLTFVATTNLPVPEIYGFDQADHRIQHSGADRQTRSAREQMNIAIVVYPLFPKVSSACAAAEPRNAPSPARVRLAGARGEYSTHDRMIEVSYV